MADDLIPRFNEARRQFANAEPERIRMEVQFALGFLMGGDCPGAAAALLHCFERAYPETPLGLTFQ